MIWNVRKRSMFLVPVLLVAVILASCGPAATPTSAPATVAPTSEQEEPTAEPMEEPTSAPTEEPTLVPTEVPTETPIPEPTETPIPREDIYFVWAPGGVPPADSDDVDGIVQDIMENEGIVSGNGNEIGINVTYYPDIITVDEIIEIFDGIGHPVTIPDND